MPNFPLELDINKIIDRKRPEIQYIGTAKLATQQLSFDQESAKYTCLANVGGMLALVEIVVHA